MPPPDLHNLIRKYGAYSKIPPEEWKAYDYDLKEYQADIRAGLYYYEWDGISFFYHGLSSEEVKDAIKQGLLEAQKANPTSSKP